MTLDRHIFSDVIRNAPLISLDLILRNKEGQVLLGYRANRPAQHTWFVPGGRIRKNERLQEAFSRIASTELGISPLNRRLLGVFEHFYDDNAFGIEGLSTHYVVSAIECDMPAGAEIAKDGQHAQLRWWDVKVLLDASDVHENTKRYFEAGNNGGFLS